MSIPTFAQIAGHEPRRSRASAGWFAGAALALFVLTPWAWLSSGTVFDLPKFALLLLAFFCASVALWIEYRERSLPFPLPVGTVLFLGATLLIGVVSMAFAPDGWRSFLGGQAGMATSGLVLMMAALGLVLSTFFVLAYERLLRGLVPVLEGMFLFGSVFLLAQYLGWTSFGSDTLSTRLFLPIGGVFFWPWFACARWLLPLAKPEERGLWVISIINTLLALGALILLDDERTLALAVLLGGWLFFKRRAVSSVLEQGARVVGLLFLLVAIPLAIPRPSAVPTVAELSWTMSAGLVGEALRTRPLVGIGATQWGMLVEKHRTLDMNQGGLYALSFDSASSWYLTMLAEYGAVMGVLLLLLFASLLFRVALVHRARLPYAVLGIALLLLATVPAWMVILAWMVLGGLAAAPRDLSERGQQLTRVWFIKAGSVSLLLLIVVGMGIYSDQLVAKAFAAETVRARRDFLARALAVLPADRQITAQHIQAQGELVREEADRGSDAYRREATAAVEMSKVATKRWPFDARLWLLQGAVYASMMQQVQGADQFAIQAFQKGLEYAPKHPPLFTGIGSVYAWRAEEAPPRAGQSVEAFEAYRAEQHRLAAQWFARALSVKEDDEAIAYAFAVQAAKAGDVVSAIPVMRRLHERFPERTSIRLEYATLLAMTGERAQAITLLESVASEEGLYTTATRLLADWYEQEQAYASAVAALKRLPEAKQPSAAFTKRLNEVELKAKRLR